jgi:uncharacterized cupin superfamily protein
MRHMNMTDVVVFADREPECEESLTPLEKCLDGQAIQRTWHQFTSRDEKFFAGTWEAEPGSWSVDYTENEYCHILSGHSLLRDAQGAERHLRAGDHLVIPAGFKGVWEVLQTTRKIYVIYQP